MEKLNYFLKQLLSSCSEELRIEPDKIPYLIANNRKEDVGNVALLGTQISAIIFPLIPDEAKVKLPNSDEIDFTHAHELGNFHFTVQKSPNGFIVAVRTAIGETSAGSITVEQPEADAAPSVAKPEKVVEPPPALDYSPVAESAPPASNYEPPAYSFGSSAGVQDLTAAGALDTLSDEATGEPAAEYVAPSEVPQLERLASHDEPTNPPVVTEPKIDYPLRRKSDFIPDAPANNMNAYQQTSTSPATSAFRAAPSSPAMAAMMDGYFKQMAEMGASDLHLSVSMPPMVRKDGKMQNLGHGDVLSAEMMRDLLHSIMPAKNQEEFDSRHDTDFAYEIADLARFRCNVFMDRKGMGGVFRIIPSKILTAEQLGLSKAIMDLCSLSKGLVVVTGPTGSGKSTTLCAMVDSINKVREDHIITIEDPIEFVHDNHKCLVNQREVHNHTDSFKDALRAALREDPDILLVGEMRDLETISIAIETAETGHLVFGTLHTTTAASTVDRIIDQFPADRQQQIRVMLSESLKGVIAQTLIPKKGGGRVAALEILIVTPAISNLIREGKTFQIPSAMQTGKNHGMVVLNDALFELVKNGTVEPKDAYIKAVDKTGFETMLTRGGFKI
ncbi:MAG: PilT/PilU family type 4a pilus ATPase [Pyrinomonadaceae bacterium]